uniref:60S ribosomal protein L35 n=1 Tax=Polytomella sp. Pringsheim 198.80 TaxID=37502 RepID=A0A024FSK3_9CHLO|nr:60S ribosomal protein L35 [Polytomella sp. Pringsheim 198.80]|mmetsp:Transcript_11214/g.20306  ORF Transcript_11214/g.20306 Transcript_11214/m.20306 type:complete len:132 (-) Transcript_11214:118-513(-)
MAKVRAHELRSKSKAELLSQLKDLKSELASLRVAQVTGGAANKISKIKVVRKGIARVLTVYRQTERAAVKSKISADNKDKTGKARLPLDLRSKKTRAIRRALTKEQKSAKLEKQKKRAAAFPARTFALKSL